MVVPFPSPPVCLSVKQNLCTVSLGEGREGGFETRKARNYRPFPYGTRASGKVLFNDFAHYPFFHVVPFWRLCWEVLRI